MRERLLELRDEARVMGIVNMTPDSFYDRTDGADANSVQRGSQCRFAPCSRGDLEEPLHLRRAGEGNGVDGAIGYSIDQLDNVLVIGRGSVDVRQDSVELRSRLPEFDSARDLAVSSMIGVAVGLPLYYGNGVLFGAHFQIRPSQYPAGWYAADRLISSDPTSGRSVFLPWPHYTGLGFVQNQNKVVELDADGKKVWEALANLPASVQRPRSSYQDWGRYRSASKQTTSRSVANWSVTPIWQLPIFPNVPEY